MKAFRIIFGIALLGVIIYFALLKDNSLTYKFPSLPAIKGSIETAVKETAGGENSNPISAISGISSIPGFVANFVFEKGKETVDKIIDGVKSSAFNIFKSAVEEKVDAIGEGFGIEMSLEETGSKAATEQKSTMAEQKLPPLIFAVKAGISANFTINNKEGYVLNYEVDWQDGKQDNGQVEKGEKKILSHNWQKAGDYEIQFTIKGNNKTNKYTFNISIF